jgi:hypothetical protein
MPRIIAGGFADLARLSCDSFCSPTVRYTVRAGVVYSRDLTVPGTVAECCREHQDVSGWAEVAMIDEPDRLSIVSSSWSLVSPIIEINSALERFYQDVGGKPS